MKYKIIDTETGKRVDDVGEKEKNDIKKIQLIDLLIKG